MKHNLRTRLLSLLLCVSMMVSLLAHVTPVHSADESENIVEETKNSLESNVGKQAIFDWWSNFLLVDDPKRSDIAEIYDTDAGSIHTDGENYWYNYEARYDEAGNPTADVYIDANGVVMSITDYYYDEINGWHWYRVSGENLPSMLEEKPWILYMTDADIDNGYDPYLAIYDKNDVIKFITSGETELNYFVVAGPAALKDATISITERTDKDYSLSALAYTETIYNTTWSNAYDITVTKSSGEAWSSADGVISVRYEAAQFGSDTYANDEGEVYIDYGAAFLYVGNMVYSAQVTDRLDYEISDVVYTNSGASTIVFEHMPESFMWENQPAYFTNENVTLYDNTLAKFESFLAANLPVQFIVSHSFIDVNGEVWYWLENEGFIGSPYFLAKQSEVTLGDLPEEYGDGRVSVTDKDGNAVEEEIILPQYQKPEFTAQTSLAGADVVYQWQIEYEDGKWVDIYGETSKTVKIFYGMVASLLSDAGKVDIRCKSQSGTSVAYSKPITITIEMYQPEEPDVVVSESLTTSSGEVVTVTVAGSIPKDASVQLQETTPEGVDVGAGETVVASLDISIKNADGTEWQPESGETVTVTLEASKIGLKNGDEFVVYHLHDGEVKILGTYIVKDDTVSFEVDGFSLFVFALAEKNITTDSLQGDVEKMATISEFYSDLWLVEDPSTLSSYTGNWYVRAIEGVDYVADIEFKITGAYVSSVYPYGMFYRVEAVDSSDLLTEVLVYNNWIFQRYQDDPVEAGTLILYDLPEETEPETPKVNITVDGEPVSEISVSIVDKVTLNAALNVEGTSTYQWQLLIPSANMWVNISGQTSAECTVNYGMVANRLDSDGKAHIRCVTTVNGTEIISEEIAVKIAETVPVSSVSSSSMARRNVMLMAGDTTLYNVVINYVFEDGTVAATPFTSKIGVTGSLTSTVEFPDVQGYLPYVNDVEQDSYTFNLHGSEMTKDFVMTVVYKPTLVNYTVVVMHQNAYNDNYTEYERKTLQALTGTVIDSDEEVSVVYPGFYQLLHKQVTIAADGSTVIEVRYDRYYYLMTFDLGEGGYGVLPVYARYGTEIAVEDPTRPGYVYEQWINPAGNVVTFPMSMPAHDIEITAVWTPSNAKYTIVYWKENADPNADGTYGYSYWGSRIVTTLAGNVVSGSDDIPTSITSATVDGETVDEKKYFTYNDTLTDKNVVVKGDGTTVVNVYYTRNYYTIYFRGYGKCCLAVHTHGTGCNSKLICSLEEHTHTDCNRTLNCDIPEHNAHTDECLICGKEEHTAHINACLQCTHAHNISCWSISGGYLRELRETNKPDEIDEDSYVSGTIYTFTTGNGKTTHRYLYFDGKWYCGYSGYYKRYDDTYVISPNCSHTTHTAACYKDEIHSHSTACYKDIIHAHNESCYKYSCGMITHSHTADCYSDCTIPVHTHGSGCNSNNTNNVVHVITAKYEADISAQWPTYDKLATWGHHYTDSEGNVENSSGSRFRGWDVDNASAEAVSKRINMTPDLCDTDQGYQYADAEYGASYSYRLYYMFESFDQTSPANGTTRKQYKVNGVTKYFDSEPAYYQELMYSSDTTFNQKEVLGMNPVGREKSTSGSGSNYVITNWLYYTRNRSNLTYQSIDTVVDTKTDIMFGESLKNYQYTGTPPYPSSLEKGAYEFGGWYTTAGCFGGTEVNFDTAKMPNGDMILYAKWEPVTHTVQFYRLKDDGGNLIDKIGDTYEVKHNQKLNEQYIPEAPEDFKNGAYSFAGWWYMDGTTERRFDFKSLPVTEDLVVYAKWTSNKQIQYNIHFKLADGTPVADSISSSDLAGTTITVDAKGGEELYPAYREGYFPNVKSHSLTLDIDAVDGVMEFSFVYTPATAVPYTVYYVAKTLKEGGTTLGTITIDEITYYIIADTEVKNDNRLAYVSENFKPVPGYVSDEFQKNLVIVPGEENVIVFYYTVDTENAPYKVTHYIQNLDGQTWNIEYSYSGIAKINSTYTENPMTIVGFTYDSTKGNASGVVTADGLELQLYYTRNKYPYKVVYKEQSTGSVLYTSNVKSEYYGKVVAESAPNTHENYTRVSEATKSITVRIEEDLDNPAVNVITFFYEETQIRLNYVIVAPDGKQFTVNQAWGELRSFGESVKISTGKANGSTATVNSSIYKFVGWYSDAACTTKIGDGATYVPTKADGVLWVNGTTYYAKFEYNLTSLTIVKAGAEAYEDIDPNQSFIFDIYDGNTLVTTVTVNSTTDWKVVVDGLTVGKQYTVTEKADWSWRYDYKSVAVKNATITGNVTNGAQITLGLDGTITFTNIRSNEYWLDGDSYKVNIFGRPVQTP